jgi:hypothetical protein
MTNRFYFDDVDGVALAAASAIRWYLSLAAGTPRRTSDGRVLLALRQMHDAHAEAFAVRFGAEYVGSEGRPLDPAELNGSYGSLEEQQAKLERRLERVRRGEVPARCDRETLTDEVRFWPGAVGA